MNLSGERTYFLHRTCLITTSAIFNLQSGLQRALSVGVQKVKFNFVGGLNTVASFWLAD